MSKDEQMLLTREGLKKLEEELENLKTSRRKEVAGRLQEAISYGDLSENAEYEEAKNEQAFVEGRIRELEQMIKNVKVVGSKKSSADTVNIGSVVEIEEISSGEKDIYTIVGTTEVEVFNNKISNESPLGSALIGQKKGSVIKYKAPGGDFEYKITKVS